MQGQDDKGAADTSQNSAERANAGEQANSSEQINSSEQTNSGKNNKPNGERDARGPAPESGAVQPRPQRVVIRFEAGADLMEKIERAKEVLAHTGSAKMLEALFNLAVGDLLDKRDPMRVALRKAEKRAKAAARDATKHKAPADPGEHESATAHDIDPNRAKAKPAALNGQMDRYETTADLAPDLTAAGLQTLGSPTADDFAVAGGTAFINSEALLERLEKPTSNDKPVVFSAAPVSAAVETTYSLGFGELEGAASQAVNSDESSAQVTITDDREGNITSEQGDIGQSDLITRYIPMAVREEVLIRSGGRCEFKSKDGKRCSGRAFLQADHVTPWALGGASTADDLRMLCAAHNRRRAEKTFGPYIKRRQPKKPDGLEPTPG